MSILKFKTLDKPFVMTSMSAPVKVIVPFSCLFTITVECRNFYCTIVEVLERSGIKAPEANFNNHKLLLRMFRSE